MVYYELTLSENPNKAICRQESARVKAMGFCRKEFFNTKKILTETIALPTHQVGTANNISRNTGYTGRLHTIYTIGVDLFKDCLQ